MIILSRTLSILPMFAHFSRSVSLSPNTYNSDVLSTEDTPLGLRIITKSSDTFHTLIATPYLQGDCEFSVVVSGWAEDVPAPPTLYVWHSSLTTKEMGMNITDHTKTQPRTSLIPFDHVESDIHMGTCITGLFKKLGLDTCSSRFDLRDPLLWNQVINRMVTYEPTDSSRSVMSTQKHFPEDIKNHIDSKRWLHALSLLVLLKDLMDHHTSLGGEKWRK